MTVLRGATLLAEESTSHAGWRCVTTVWVAANSTYGARVLATHDAELRRQAALREAEGEDEIECSEADAASVLAISEGVKDLSDLERTLSRGFADPVRQGVPEGLLDSSVAKALLRARLTRPEKV